MPNHHHRAGGLRQSNKKNKRAKSSKRSLTRAAGGRVNGNNNNKLSASANSHNVGVLSKANRKNRQDQLRQHKKQAALLQRRGISGAHAAAGTGRTGGIMAPSIAPRVVGIVSLGRIEPQVLEERVKRFVLLGADKVVGKTTTTAKYNVHKRNGTLTVLTCHSLAQQSSTSTTTNDKDTTTQDEAIKDEDVVMAALDLARVCDVMLFVVDGNDRSAADEEGVLLGGEIDIGSGGMMIDTHTISSKSTAHSSRDWDHLVSAKGDAILAGLKAQGLPSPLTVLANPSGGDDGAATTMAEDMRTMQSFKSVRRAQTKRRLELKKYVSRFATTEFGSDHDKVVEIELLDDEDNGIEHKKEDTSMEEEEAATISGVTTSSLQRKQSSANLVRLLVSMSCRPARWVADLPRPYLLADRKEFIADTDELRLTGYIRGVAPWDVNSLVHVPNLGTFCCKSIAKTMDPLKARANSMAMEPQEKVLYSDPELQESLNMFASPDALEGEQNLVGFDGSDDVDFEDNDDDGQTEGDDKIARPAGWSDYQAAWLDDSDALDDGEVADHGELARELNQPNQQQLQQSSSGATVATDAMDLEEANQISEEERQHLMAIRKKEETEHQQFPDEVQVDEDVKASERFARYRSLKSFRKSYWDPKENLPDSYASLYHFSSFKGTQRAVMNDTKELIKAAQKVGGCFWGSTPQFAEGMDEEEDYDDVLEGCVPSGSYVTITLEKVPGACVGELSDTSLVTAVSLLPHENKVSVLHMGLNRPKTCDTTVKSKDILTFRCGWRTFQGRPSFSQHNLNCDKHKFERFLPPSGAFFAASVFGPVTYTPCPVLAFRGSELVATGTMLGADADRIVIKRIILTGFPVRVHKRHSTVKYMFYNPDDVKWFKPAGLYTKHGLQGHIVQSVGEHGTMKCLFNAPIKQHDTVCLPLYKRIYPKFANSEDEQNEEKTFKERYQLFVR